MTTFALSNIVITIKNKFNYETQQIKSSRGNQHRSHQGEVSYSIKYKYKFNGTI